MPPYYDPTKNVTGNILGLQEQTDLLRQQELEKQKQMLAPKEFSPSKAAAEAALAFLPMLVGYAADKYRGGAMGAKVGAQGATTYNALEDAKEKEADSILALDAQSLGAERQNAQKQLNALQMESAKGQIRLGELGPKLENERAIAGIRAGAQKDVANYKHGLENTSSEDPLVTQARAKQLADPNYKFLPEETSAISAQASKNPRSVEQMMINQRQANAREQPRILPPATIDRANQRASAITQLQNLGQMIAGPNVDETGLQILSSEYSALINKYAKDNKVSVKDAAAQNPGMIDSILARNASRVDPNSATGKVFKESRRIANEVALARAGVATDQDVQREIEQLVAGGIETKGTYLQRINRILGYQKREMNNFMKALQDPTPQGLQKLYQEQGVIEGISPSMATLDDGSNTKPLPAPSQEFLADAKARNLTREQARAEWAEQVKASGGN